jgi:hypothetical protein
MLRTHLQPGCHSPRHSPPTGTRAASKRTASARLRPSPCGSWTLPRPVGSGTFSKATESSGSERATHQKSAGRKSGLQESQWLLRFHTHGQPNNSFQPPAEIRVVRNDGSVQTSSFTAPCAWPTHVNTNPCTRESASSPSSVSIRIFPSNSFVLQVPH